MWLAGMQCSDWRLNARVIGAPFLVLTNASPSAPTLMRFYVTAGPGLPPVLGFTLPIPAAHPHFPYGVAVSPD